LIAEIVRTPPINLHFVSSQHIDALYRYSNCLSVRHTPVLDENGLTDCYSFFTTR